MQEKHPRESGQTARPVFILKGVTGVDPKPTIAAMLATLPTAGDFIGRATNSKSGDPRSATSWLNAPLLGAQAETAFRSCIEIATGMSKDEAKRYTFAGCRKFLPHVAEMAISDPSVLLELGRWSGSVASKMPLNKVLQTRFEEALEATQKRARISKSYTGSSVIEREAYVRGILTRQLETCRRVLAAHTLEGLPMHGGWDLFRKMDSDSPSPSTA